MYKTLDACLLQIPGSIPELAPLARKYGFEGVNVPADILDDEKKAAEALAAVREYGLKWGLLPTPVDFFHEDVEGNLFEDGLRRLEKWAAVGEKLGVRYSYNHIWSSNSYRAFDENFDWHVRRLERIQSIFANHGIQYGFEFLGPYELRVMHEHPFVHTIAGVLAIADAAGGATGFLFDTYHWHCGSRRLDDLYFASKNCHRMVNMHLNDGIAGRTPDEQRDLERAMPMTTGVIDAAMIYRVFRENGYQGPAMIEPLSPSRDRFSKMPMEDSVREVSESFDRVERGILP